MAGVFGSTISESHVEDAYIATLRKWINTYLNDAEGDHGIQPGRTPRPKSYRAVFGPPDNWPEEALPAVQVLCPDSEAVERRGNGAYDVVFTVGVFVFLSGRDEKSTRLIAQVYGSAIAKALTQYGSLGGLAQNTTFIAREFDAFPSGDNRTLRMVSCEFTSYVAEAINGSLGPAIPDPDPDPQHEYPNWPEVTDVEVEIQAEEI